MRDLRRLAPVVAAGVLTATVLTAPAAAAVAPAETAPDGATLERVEAHLREHRDRVDVPGMAWAVVDAEGVVAEGALGRDGDGAAVTPRTAFLWGSVAKPVTAALALRLADAGRLDLDAAVSNYLPGVASTLGARVTVRDLVRQTSGLPTSLALTDRFDAGRRPGDVVADLRGTDADPPGEYHYSSTNYLVLGAVVEAATGRPFVEALEGEVLEPLGMASAVTTPAEAERSVPPGHRYLAGRPVAFESPYDPAGVAYGYLGGDVRDLAAFASDALAPQGRVLGADGLARSTAGVTAPGYGLGWRVWSGRELGLPDDERVVWHGGAAPGYQAAVVLLPERGTGVVVLQDAYGASGDRRLLDGAFGAAALLGEGEPRVTGAGPADALLLGGLGVLLAGLVAALVRTTRRAVRPPRRTVRREVAGLVAWAAGGGVAVAAVLRGLPVLAGVDLRGAALWAPDVAWAVTVLVGLVVACVVARTAGVALAVARR